MGRRIRNALNEVDWASFPALVLPVQAYLEVQILFCFVQHSLVCFSGDDSDGVSEPRSEIEIGFAETSDRAP